VQLVILPLFHTGGLNCYANPVLHAGGTILIMRAFEPGLALDYISDPSSASPTSSACRRPTSS
jgi:fatty-acyl-CoA synthase